MVSIGEVEFLINFRSMNTEFKKVLQESMKDIGAGVDVNLQKKIDDIVRYLSIISPSTGGRDDYYVFTAKAEKLIPQMDDENRRKLFTDAIIAAASGPRSTRISRLIKEEDESITGEKVREKADILSNKIFDMMKTKLILMSKNPIYHQTFKQDWQDIEAGIKQMEEGKIKSEPFFRIINKLFNEDIINRTWTNLLEEWGVSYTAKVGPDVSEGFRVGGEKALHKLTQTIRSGEGERTSIKDFMEFGNLLIKESDLNEEEIKDLYLLVKEDLNIEIKEKLTSGLEEILKTSELFRGMLMPKSIIEIIQDITGETGLSGRAKLVDVTWIITEKILEDMGDYWKERGVEGSPYIQKFKDLMEVSTTKFILGMLQGKIGEKYASDTPSSLMLLSRMGFNKPKGSYIEFAPTFQEEELSPEKMREIIGEAFKNNLKNFEEMIKTTGMTKEEFEEMASQIVTNLRE